ncbi:hypothetical protein COO91_01693 [Nostoc flagelliforme CCNUN1]|uniref:Uncharacterized protein n=1 Tax=Nostoc flagelliforme CCNUN1 TaxID=2038116 RepID=A0A2K8SK43_9NOSO|nr:hypothetical protein [Nostoc flagelliforme]AUB35802.1 hypothetical protein COO91_01693 [Nostoc flagelliforme CCNUN1]
MQLIQAKPPLLVVEAEGKIVFSSLLPSASFLGSLHGGKKAENFCGLA